MKKIINLILVLMLSAAFFLPVCAEKVTDPEELAFDLGFKMGANAFTGDVYFSPMIQNDDVYNFPATNNIIFSPGARSHWHTHGGMIILGTGGEGYYQAEGEPVQVIREGDVVEIRAGVRHWHGAAPDSWFSQMVIYDSSYVSEDAAEEIVTDEYYQSLQVEDNADEDGDGFMFTKAENPFISDTFSGTAWVSNIIGGNNVAGAPGLHYVIFDNGVINNWHIHEGGQILIATDGIGYHQIEGQPVEVMHPGDVAYCPPGIMHWHGGSVGTQFAHIAVNTNPEMRGLTWLDRISPEEYAALSTTEEADDETMANEAEVSDPTIVQTTAGMIRGSDLDGIYRYLGVPYAHAEELFVPAVPAEPWEGVRDALEYGPMSYQSGMFGTAAQEASENESNDAQNLNIWTPGSDDAKRPVMVWLHGGGFSSGTANQASVDGENLSRAENVVVVGVNHRLGVFGHLDLSAYGDKYRYSANVGVMDIIDALKWIKENIAAFGGDPENVTLFGQSGGGAKVLALMASPYANDLFERGIVESGATETMGVIFTRQKVSLALGEAIIAKLGITPENIDAIQNVTFGELQSAAVEAQNEIAEKFQIAVSIGTGYAYEWEPVIDGDFLPENPVLEEGFAANAFDYPMMIGSNLNEWNTFMAALLQHTDMSDEARAAYASAYPNEDPAGAEDVDTLLRLPLLKITAHKADQNGGAVYSYVFTKQSGNFGSSHGAEMPYVFGNNAENEELAATVLQFWASFARDGVPAAAGMDEWEPYTRESGAVMIIDDTTYLTHHHDEELLSLLAPEYEW